MSSRRLSIHILLISMLILPGCIKGCDYDQEFQKGREMGKKVGIDKAMSGVFPEVKEEARKEFYEKGYARGVNKGISAGKYSYDAVKTVFFILIFSVLGFLVQYMVSFFLRKKGFIDDIDDTITPSINSMDLSNVSSGQMKEMLESTINRLGNIVERKMISSQPAVVESQTGVRQNPEPIRTEAETECPEPKEWTQPTAPEGIRPRNIRFACQCGKTFNVSPSHSGQKGKCKYCGRILTVPSVANE